MNIEVWPDPMNAHDGTSPADDRNGKNANGDASRKGRWREVEAKDSALINFYGDGTSMNEHRVAGMNRRGSLAVASQRPSFRTWIEQLERMAEQGDQERPGGVLFLVARGAPAGNGVHSLDGEDSPARSPRARSRDRGCLKGILFPENEVPRVVLEGRTLGEWLQELREGEGGRDAVRVLLEALESGGWSQHGLEVRMAQSFKEAQSALGSTLPDLVLVDLPWPEGCGPELLRGLQEESALAVVRVDAEGGPVPLLEDGVEHSGTGVRAASGPAEKSGSTEDASVPRRPVRLTRFGPMVGGAQAMQRVYELIARVAPTEATVLITGESGTGKELVAQAIHAGSRRARKPFFVVNCGAMSPSLIDSELFGHEQGSFTGASHLHKGHFERASGGTIFLDEITEMPLELQVKLLRVLENGNFLRVGGDQPINVDVRVLAATNRKPEEAIADGKLREDLFYRLNVFPIHLPPLAERQEDLDLLAEYFLNEMNRAEGTSKRFTRAALERMRAYHWPGNVRELKNVLQRAYILAEEKITAECLPREVGGKDGPAEASLQVRVGTPLAEAERRLILATFEQCEGNKMKTAEMLGISLRTLYNRLDSYWQGEQVKERETQSA